MFGLLKKFFPKIQTDTIEVNISELSPIWLKHNNTFTPTIAETQPAPQEAPGTPEERKFFSTEVLSEFYEPYRKLLETQNASDGFLKIIEFLDRYGNCPSVVTAKSDPETEEIYSLYSILAKVTLREHSSNVARIMLKLLQETYRDYENLIPKALVASFGHDLGKATTNPGDLYAKGDHPPLSAQKLQELFGEKTPLWFQSVLQSILDHHRATKDQFTNLLKEADSRARQLEVERHSELKSIPWEQWFDTNRFLEIMKPEINVIQTGNRWKAFSFGSVVYFQPDFLYESAKKLAQEKKVLDMRLMKTTDKEIVIQNIVESLRKNNVLGPDIGEGYRGRFYEIKSDRFKKKMFLIPIKIETFGIPHEIEKLKEGYLEIIREVVPAKK